MGCGLFRLDHCFDSWDDFLCFFFLVVGFLVELEVAVMVVVVWWCRDGGYDGGGN